jgi:predicted ATPase
LISRIAISGYRSLRDLTLPLGDLTVVTGPNGSGKSSVYRSLRLLADIADDRIIASLAREGGFESVRWAGPERISRAMSEGAAPIQGTTRKNPVALKLGFTEDDTSYSIELGMPIPGQTMFGGDPEIKREVLWTGDKLLPSRIIADRRGPSIQVRTAAGEMHHIVTNARPYDSLVRAATGPNTPWEIGRLRDQLAAWRFYDHFRTDETAPARQLHAGTRTTAISPDGRDIAAAIQTINEIGDTEGLAAAIDNAFPGASLDVTADHGLFRLQMNQHGMLRPLGVTELSDGTLRFTLLAAALLAPRPAPLMVFNEPEAGLHGDLIPALASLIARASENSQVIVVSHNRNLVATLLGVGAELIELQKDTGETNATTNDVATWHWPAR